MRERGMGKLTEFTSDGRIWRLDVSISAAQGSDGAIYVAYRRHVKAEDSAPRADMIQEVYFLNAAGRYSIAVVRYAVIAEAAGPRQRVVDAPGQRDAEMRVRALWAEVCRGFGGGGQKGCGRTKGSKNKQQGSIDSGEASYCEHGRWVYICLWDITADKLGSDTNDMEAMVGWWWNGGECGCAL